METGKIQCPCCDLLKDQNEVQTLLEQFYLMKSGALKSKEVTIDFDWLVSMLEGGWKQWACDQCLKSGKAIIADSSKMNFTVSPKYLAYFDKKITCETCKKDFIFSAQEQQYWFETLKFWQDSYPKKCLTCRKKIRQQSALHTELFNLTKDLDKDNPDPNQLQRITEIYEELGVATTEKARRYTTLMKKKLP